MKQPNENTKFEAYGILLLAVASLIAVGWAVTKFWILMYILIGIVLFVTAVLFTLGAAGAIDGKLKAFRETRERETKEREARR